MSGVGKVLIFGATGMVGQGVLRECLLSSSVRSVLAVGRAPTGVTHAKLRDVVIADPWDYSSIEGELAGFDACFFCLGVASAGMTEAAYERITYGIAIAAAGTLCRLNPGMTFIFVSGAGADSSERGRAMWARVKGKAENAILKMPFAASYVFRPGLIVPLHGIQSRTTWYRVFYRILKPLLPLLRFAFPDHVITTEQIGLAMLSVATHGFPRRILESSAIRKAAIGPGT